MGFRGLGGVRVLRGSGSSPYHRDPQEVPVILENPYFRGLEAEGSHMGPARWLSASRLRSGVV